ncbi:MAG: hypothetical protein AB7S49_02900 [Arcobacter sp.]|uniref:hypothetical protein n=1 Tax=Arcobacter sp. TaxID=1872629 RepID=UPI003CFF46A5
MPQLIAMIIVVVGAMIYMFQTFGGTGDKVEGIAQKTSIVTEINNIKNGLQLAMRGGDITATTPNTLAGLAGLAYFADQMNTEIRNNAGTVAFTATANINQNANTYSAISFGGESNPALFLSYIAPAAVGDKPAIRVQIAQNGALWANRAFLESQLSNDLSAIAAIDRTTINGDRVAIVDNEVPAANRPATVNVGNNVTNNGVGTATTTLDDGVFTVYFKDITGVTAN